VKGEREGRDEVRYSEGFRDIGEWGFSFVFSCFRGESFSEMRRDAMKRVVEKIAQGRKEGRDNHEITKKKKMTFPFVASCFRGESFSETRKETMK
jgi:hypothetical protein